MMMADSNTWFKILTLYRNTSDVTLLEALSCSEDPVIILKYLDLAASMKALFPDRRYIYVFNSIVTKHARKEPVLNYILQYFETIKPK